MDPRDALFIISVASRLVEMHPSTLRKYESCGLLEPCRMSGRLRLYSPEDIARLRQIKVLVEERSFNLAGVKLALALTAQLRELRELTDGTADPDKLCHEVRARCAQMLNLLGAGSSDDEPGADRHPMTRRN